MKIIKSRIIPLKGFAAMNVLGVIFVRPEAHLSRYLLNHELIHTAQMRELGYLPFYILYVLEWVVRLFMRGNAYRNISFEREAYRHDTNPDYLNERRHFAQWRKNKHY